MKKFLVIGGVLFGSFFFAQEVQAKNFLGGLWDGLTDKECGLLGAENILDSFDFSGGEKPVFDGPGLKRGAKLVKCRLDGGVSKEEDLKILLIGWAKFILSLASILAVVALIWAGFLYVTAGGEDAQMEKAKKVVIWVVVGIILILGSYAIVNTFQKANLGAPGGRQELQESFFSDKIFT